MTYRVSILYTVVVRCRLSQSYRIGIGVRGSMETSRHFKQATHRFIQLLLQVMQTVKTPYHFIKLHPPGPKGNTIY